MRRRQLAGRRLPGRPSRLIAGYGGFGTGLVVGSALGSSYGYYGSPYDHSYGYYDDGYYDEGAVAVAPGAATMSSPAGGSFAHTMCAPNLPRL